MANLMRRRSSGEGEAIFASSVQKTERYDLRLRNQDTATIPSIINPAAAGSGVTRGAWAMPCRSQTTNPLGLGEVLVLSLYTVN